MNCLVFVIAICRLNASVPAMQEDARFEVHGAVRDSSGAVVPGAQVNLNGADFERGQTTDAQGRFSFSSVPVSTAAIRVEAVGFTMVERQWEAHSQGPAALEIVLTPAPPTERIVVTATLTPQRVSDMADSITILAHQDLSATAALTLDGALRQVPGFVLFRRTGSLTSNPTAQGVSLRGAGSSEASRAVVLDDGLPLNDPYWWLDLLGPCSRGIGTSGGGGSGRDVGSLRHRRPGRGYKHCPSSIFCLFTLH